VYKIVELEDNRWRLDLYISQDRIIKSYILKKFTFALDILLLIGIPLNEEDRKGRVYKPQVRALEGLKDVEVEEIGDDYFDNLTPTKEIA